MVVRPTEVDHHSRLRPRPRALIFDWGGVFTRSAPGSARRAFERRLGLAPGGLGSFFDEEPWLLFSTGRQAQTEFWNNVCETFPIRPDPITAQALWTHLFEAPEVRAELVRLLPTLRQHARIGLLSNAGPGLRRLIGEIGELFDDIVISAEVGTRKPEPDIYRLSLRNLGVDPAEALFVDDLLRNVEAARLVGLETHHFVGPGRLRRALARRGLIGDTTET